jgi:phosphoribosylformylglycinamidine cyclo-ligase
VAEAERGGLTYRSAGVDVEAAERLVSRIARLAEATRNPGVVGSLGGFAGLYRLGPFVQGRLLVASTDGVGTKSAVAVEVGRYDSIGLDLVAMCVDDLVCCGAEPHFLLDYLVFEHLDEAVAEAVIAGVAEGCRLAGVALLGGETAEHPGLMPSGLFDLAGFAVGSVAEEALWGSWRIEVGDVLVGLSSPGLRSNGYSLARRALLVEARRSLKEEAWEGAGRSLGEELLCPSVIYAPSLLRLRDEGLNIKVAAHITGGGIPGNLVRVLPAGLDAVVDRGTWSVPRIFHEVKVAGRIAELEMERTFNMGVGMLVVVSAEHAPRALELLGPSAWRAGWVEPGEGRVRMVGSWRWGDV